MKGNKIDELFQKGLTSHKISAPSTAWDKIETQLPKQSKKGVYFWLSIAASIMLIFTFSWLIVSNTQDNSAVNNSLAADTTPVEEVTPKAEEDNKPEVIKPIIQPDVATQSLVAVTDEKEDKKENLIELNRQAAKPVVQLAKLTEEAEPTIDIAPIIERESIELIVIDPRRKPKYSVTESIVQNNLLLKPSLVFEEYLNSYQGPGVAPSRKKRFSLLSGIVSVAKGVNSGKVAISEIRKSKNEFISNDLKYGNTEGQDEDLEDDPKREEDNLDNK